MISNLTEFTTNGLQIPENVNTIFEAIAQEYIAIYNLPADKIFTSNEPDGQQINILAMIAYEVYLNLVKALNSIDPATALGVNLDNIANYHYIKRRGGSFTLQNIDIVLNRTTTLIGLDTNYDDINAVSYAVEDNKGQKFYLINTITLNAGTHTLSFRASDYGEILTTANTITNPIDILAGVVSVNNSTSQSSIGASEETDEALRIRFNQSPALQSQSILEGLQGSLANISNVINVKILDNPENTIDSNGIPPHYVWVIVEGGLDLDIAKVILYKLTAGVGMKGDVLVNVTQVNGVVKVVKFDRPILENLYIRLNIKRTSLSQNFISSNVSRYIAQNKQFAISEFADSANFIEIILAYITLNGGGGVPINLEISKDNLTWFEFLETTTQQHKFTLDIANISITII
jgi:uncharacterized phage protein gp47/JayE